MIRKLFGLIIFGILFFNVSFGYDYLSKYINLPGSFLEGGYENSVSSALNFSNNYGNKWLSISDSQNGYYYIFWNNGKLYFYDNGFYSNGGTQNKDNVTQGYFEQFCKVENWKLGTGEGESMWPCPSYAMTVAVGSEFYSLSGVDFDIMLTSLQDEGDDPGLCFNNRNNGYIYCTNKWNNGIVLTGTLNIGSGVDGFSSFAQNSPFFSTSSIPEFSLDNVYCPTVGQLINNYNRNGFSSGLCYSSSKIYNGFSFVSVEPQSIFDLFSSKEDFISSLSKFATYCQSSVYNSDVCASAFSGEYLRFNLISKIPNNSSLGGSKSLYNYCELYNYDPNTTTCVGSGINSDFGSDFNYDDVVHIIGEGNYSIVSPFTSGSVFDNGSGYAYSGDVITNIQNLFKKFTSLFSKQTSNFKGFLPSWILIPFILLVLFKLFKK